MARVCTVIGGVLVVVGLAVALGFNEIADLHNLKRVESVYRFFGQQPYWVERETR